MPLSTDIIFDKREMVTRDIYIVCHIYLLASND